MSVSTLLSSMTEFIDSIHSVSTGASNRIHFSSGRSSNKTHIGNNKVWPNRSIKAIHQNLLLWREITTVQTIRTHYDKTLLTVTENSKSVRYASPRCKDMLTCHKTCNLVFDIKFIYLSMWVSWHWTALRLSTRLCWDQTLRTVHQEIKPWDWWETPTINQTNK